MSTEQLQVTHCELALEQTSDWGGFIIRWSKDFRSDSTEKTLRTVQAEVFRVIGYDLADGTFVFDQVEISQNEKVEKNVELDYETPILRFRQDWDGSSDVWFAHHLRCCDPHVMFELADLIRYVMVETVKMFEDVKYTPVKLPKNDLRYNPPTPFTPRPMTDGIQKLPFPTNRLVSPYGKWRTT